MGETTKPDVHWISSALDWPVLRFVLMLAAFCAIVYVIEALGPVFIPFLQAGFVAVIASRPVESLVRRRVPRPLAAIAIVLCVLSIAALVVTLIVAGVADVGRDLPRYEARFREIVADLALSVAAYGVEVPVETVDRLFEPTAVMRVIARTAQGLGGSLVQFIFVLLIATYALLDAPKLRQRLADLSPSDSETEETIESYTTMIYRYLTIKTVVSFGTGGMAGFLMALIGVPYAMLWGLLTILLNYIPQVGSIIAGIPPVVLALLTMGPAPAVLTLGAFLLANFVFGNVMEPRLLGRGFGLPIVLVLFSLGFWGWIFRATGVFLAVPLTMTVIFALYNHHNTRQVAFFLTGSRGLPGSRR